jgi:glycolate oxidase FAD binding subunit
MSAIEPTSDSELAAALLSAVNSGRSIRLGDAPIQADVSISTRAMKSILRYEPRDLTISVEAGVRFGELSSRLAADGLMLPLDPPWMDSVTIGGMIAANLSGPRRRLYGTARDLVIGMRFATVDGALVDTGGMVVKNVAGLDMAKLLIGSHGTLAAMASVNFKLIPLPKQSRTILFEYKSSAEAFACRDRILKSILPVAALDLLNPQAATRCGCAPAWTVALRAVTAVSRYGAEFPGGRDVDCETFWIEVREFTPRYLHEHPNAVVTRYSTTHTGLRDLMEALEGPAVARAGSGVLYGYQTEPPAAPPLPNRDRKEAGHRGHATDAAPRVVEYGPPGLDRWPSPGAGFPLMQRVKQMLDPKGLLNPGAYYGRI